MAGAAPEAMVATGVRCAVADRRCIRLRGRRRSLARGPALPDQSHRHRRAAAGRGWLCVGLELPAPAAPRDRAGLLPVGPAVVAGWTGA
ncbi:hypothetical protein G6F40_016777 [Rhizopus arrhizus]|nr:hypothetical protein G6F40_016777 [Rhizopus arrhizus]